MNEGKQEFRKAMVVATSLQIPLTLMFAPLTDCGQLFQFWLVALAAFWTGYALIKWKRPENPTKLDLIYIRWGIVPLMIVAPAITIGIWKLRGLNWE